MENQVTIFFKIEDGADVDEIKSTLAEGIAGITDVEESDLYLRNQRLTGAEVVATIGAVILVAKSAQEAVDAIRTVIASVTELVKDVKGLKDVVVETTSGPKNIEEVTTSDFA